MRKVTLAIALATAVAASPGMAPDAHAAELVPDVVGLTVEKAEEILKAAGYEAVLTYVAEGADGVVLQQTPGGLTALREGGRVTLEVGGDRPLPAVPDLAPPSSTPRLPPPASAPGATAPTPPGSAPPPSRPPASPAGRPPVTAPTARVDLDALTPGHLPARNGPPIPSALGLTAPQAEQALAQRWRLRVEYTVGLPNLADRVVNQAPFPGSPLAPGETVTIVVAIPGAPGPEHQAVPTLKGGTAQRAVEVLGRAGYLPRLLGVPSKDAERGEVVAQAPLAGSLLPKGQAVTVVVGRGGLGGPPAPGPSAPREVPVAVPGALRAPPAGASPSPIQPSAPTAPAPRAPAPAPAPAPLPVPQPSPPPPTTTATPEPVAPPPAPIASLGKPTLISPSEGQSFPRAYGATFQWTGVPGAARYEWELEAQGSDGRWIPVTTQRVDGTRHRPKRMEIGRFRWRVRARRDVVEGAWSPWFRLYMY